MEQTEIQAIWEKILEKLRDTITESACQRWFYSMKPLALTETALSLRASNDFSKRYVEDHYIPFIQDAAFIVLERKLEIRVETDELTAQTPQKTSVSYEPPAQESLFVQDRPLHHNAYGETPHFLSVSPGDASSLKAKYTFENFVTGNSNRLAHAAALAVVEAPGTVYNPLFLYGGVGLGKTHLMHAIGNQILKNHPQMRVLYISSEKFLNEFIASIREGKPSEFRQKYRSIDVLLVDDIQFLYTRERTQEEFFHTFNTLYDADKAIILSADRHPREIKIIEDRLRSRFEWGLITDIKAPDLETRIAILQKKAISDQLEISNDVLYFIASRVDSNIRELEGALTRVVAQSSLDNQPITLELAGKAMKGSYPTERTKAVTLELIQDVTASYFKISTNDLIAKKRTRDLAFARQVAMYLCRKLTDTSLPQIGEYFGGRDHTTVMHAYDKIAKKCESDAQANRMLKELTERIQQM